MTETTYAIVPAYNEAQRIGDVLEGLKKHVKHIIVVDDGSVDRTSDVAREHSVDVIRHITNIGKGAALKTGCDYATSKGAQYLIAIDADGQHNPEEVPKFLEKMTTYDLIFGVRVYDNNMPAVLKFGNKFINKVTQMLYGIKLQDTQCGFRAFSIDTYKKIRWTAPDYSMESEMIANLGKKHLSYYELPIQNRYLDRYKGTTVFDGIKIVLNMCLWRFSK